jgi:hypothetical protein
MKLLINDKRRNIYFRKDNSAYYKSGGSENDVTSMFKKTGGGLKKQFSNLLIEGDENYNNMLGGKPKKTKSRKNKLVGGVTTKIEFIFEPIDVDFDPNYNPESKNDDARLAALKKVHKTLLLLSILKALETDNVIKIKAPTLDKNLTTVGNDYTRFKVSEIKTNVKTALATIDKHLTPENREDEYEKLQPLMDSLVSDATPAAAATAPAAAAPVAAPAAPLTPPAPLSDDDV